MEVQVERVGAELRVRVLRNSQVLDWSNRGLAALLYELTDYLKVKTSAYKVEGSPTDYITLTYETAQLAAEDVDNARNRVAEIMSAVGPES